MRRQLKDKNRGKKKHRPYSINYHSSKY